MPRLFKLEQTAIKVCTIDYYKVIKLGNYWIYIILWRNLEHDDDVVKGDFSTTKKKKKNMLKSNVRVSGTW